MAHIQVHGSGVTLYVTEISPEIAEELTQTGVSIDRFEEIRGSEKTHAAGIRDDMEVFVDGRRITAPPETQSPETPIALEPGKHYLIVRETAEGRWLDIATADPFDPEKLAAKVSTYLLSDGESITVTEVEYQGASAIGETEVVDEDATVIFPDGVSADVLIAGDAEGEDDELADEDDENDEDELLIVTSSAVARPPAKKPPAKKPAAKKPPGKASAKKTAGKKSPAKKAAPKKAAPKKASAKKRTAKKAQAKKTVAKTAPAKKKGGRSKR
jgi:hypothetical protein